MRTKERDYQSYPRLHNQFVRQQGAINSLLRHAGKSPPMNYEEFKRLADAALENIESAIRFLNDGRIEEAAICAIHAMEYFVAAGEVTGLPLARRGQKELLAGRKANVATYGTEDERLQRYRGLQVFVDELKKKRPDIKSYTALCKEAARQKKDISYKTIWRYTKNPYK